MKDRFLSVCYVHGSINIDTHESKEEAINKLNYGADNGLCMPSCVIDLNCWQIVWKEDFLSEEEIQSNFLDAKNMFYQETSKNLG